MERKSISKKDRFEVFKRDSFKCQYCGKCAPDIILEIDHIIPVSKGGANEIMNYVSACFDCNRGKSDRELSDDSVIKQQRNHIELLSERREQLDMIIRWKTEFDGKNIEIEAIQKHIENITNNEICLSDAGIKIYKTHLKKYGFEEVVSAINTAFDRYDKDVALNKVKGVLSYNAASEETKKIMYIKGIARNRFHYYNPAMATQILNTYFSHHDNYDGVIEFTKECKNWSTWKNGLEIDNN